MDPWGLARVSWPTEEGAAAYAMLAAKYSPAATGKADSAAAGIGVAQEPAARILQTDESIAVWVDNVNVMATQGCFFLSSLGVAQTETGVTFTAEEILGVVETTQSSGALNADMSVVPGWGAEIVTAALAQAGSGLAAEIVGGTGYTGPADASLVRGLLVNGGQHWREGDPSGDVTWDPYPGLQFRAGRTSVDQVYYRFVPRR